MGWGSFFYQVTFFCAGVIAPCGHHFLTLPVVGRLKLAMVGYLHHGSWQTLQIQAPPPPPECQVIKCSLHFTYIKYREHCLAYSWCPINTC